MAHLLAAAGIAVVAASLLSNKENKVTKLFDSVTEKTNEIILRNTSDCATANSFTQIIDVNCEVSDNVQTALANAYDACLKGNPGNAEKCPISMLYGCNISDITQDAIVSSRTSCSLTTQQINDIQSEIHTVIDNSTDTESDALGQALVNVSKIFDTSSTTTENITKVKNVLKDSMSVDNINKMVSTFTASQAVKIQGQSVMLKNVAQKMNLTIVAEAALGNAQMRKIAEMTLIEAENTEKTKTKGLTDIVDDITSIVDPSNLVWIVVVIAGVIVLVILLMVLTSGGGVPEPPMVMAPPPAPSSWWRRSSE